MRSLTLVASVALLALAFAGCADDPERYPDGVPATSSTTTTSATTTTTAASATSTSSAPVPNRGPTGSLAAQANGTVLNVTLTGQDPDGDALTWSLAFGDGNSTNGTELPVTLNHTYAASGIYNLTYQVSDGELQATYNASVNASAAAGGIPQPYTFTGTAVGAHDPVATGEGAGDAVVHAFAVTGPVTSLHALLTWEPGAPGTDLDLYIDDFNGDERGSSACANFDPIPFPLASCNRAASEELTITLGGAAEMGEWAATIVPFEAPMVTYTLVIDFT